MPEASINSDSAAAASGETVEVVPVLAETARVEKRVVTTGRTVIHKTVQERDEVVEALLARQDVTVERVPVGRVVDAPPVARQDGDTWVVPILEEQLVVEKRLVLKEELHIRTVTRHDAVRETVRLREEHVAVEHDEQRIATRPPPGAQQET